MITVIVPIVVLIVLIFAKKVPLIRGNVSRALLVAGILALVMGGIYNPLDWGKAWIDGLDRLAWVMALAFFGSIYAETQTEMKTLDLVIDLLRIAFGKSPRGLIMVIIIALGIAGSLLGDAIASATVIGILVVGILHEMELKGEEIAAVITMGATIGSIMPPITQAVFLSSSLTGIEPNSVVNVSYVTVSIGLVLGLVYSALRFVHIDRLPEHLIPKESMGQLMKGNWSRMVPLFVLIAIVILYAAFQINVVELAIGGLLEKLSRITVLKGIANSIVTFLIVATLIACCYPQVRKNLRKVSVTGAKNALPALKIQASAALLLGSFYFAGQIEAVKEFTMNLGTNLIKIGGASAEVLISALTGSQSTGQNTIFSFFSQALLEIGVDPVHVAIVGSHLANGGQSLPPASLTALVVCGLVGGIINKEVNPIKTMILVLPMSLYFIAVGFLFMYI